MNLDKTDQDILKILRKDARTPFTEVGRKLDISDSTVHVRVKRMLHDGIIKRYTIVVNGEVFGKTISGFVLININPGTLEEVIEQLQSLNNISPIYEIHGSCDLILRIWGNNLDDLRDHIIKIRKIPNVTSSELITVYKIWKDEDT